MDVLDQEQCRSAPSCPICGKNSFIVDKVRTINPDSESFLSLRECFACRHWWVDPLPSQSYLSKLYGDHSQFVVPTKYNTTDRMNAPEQRILKRYIAWAIRQFVPSGKFNYLEVGVGSGHLFSHFEKLADLSYGVELGAWAPKNAHIVNNLDQIPQGVKFDLIVIQDVLEHLENPTQMLKKLKGLSKEGGLLCCGFPNKDSGIARLRKGRWNMMTPLGHVQFFSALSTKKMFSEAGWKVTSLFCCRSAMFSPADLFKQFDWKIQSPLHFARRLKHLLIDDILLGKDQWYVQGRAQGGRE